MQVIHSPAEIYQLSLDFRAKNYAIGLVPTMGALHKGHFELINKAKGNCDVVVVSIFVNPLQFNNQEDLKNYPRNLNQDIESLSQLGVDIVFAPSEEAMYPLNPVISLDFGGISSKLEGSFRPGHFAGVGLVVAKLFNLILPHQAYFGLKDLQQYLLMRKMIDDLSFQVEIIGVPIVRESSGLAMSSRNQRLSENGKQIASHIFQGLKRFKALLEEGWPVNETKKRVIDFYKHVNGFKLEYLEAVEPDTLEEKVKNDGSAIAICVAGYVEGIRLIDNLYLRQY